MKKEVERSTQTRREGGLVLKERKSLSSSLSLSTFFFLFFRLAGGCRVYLFFNSKRGPDGGEQHLPPHLFCFFFTALIPTFII